jgi:predicted O-methyltransferase YrrM
MTQTPQTHSPSATDNSITGRIMQIRHLQYELRKQPVTGSFAVLKKIIYKIIHTTFTRQHNLNVATLDLIEKIYQEISEKPTERRLDTNRVQFQAPQFQAPQVQPALHKNEVSFSTGEVLASCGQTQDQAKLNNIRPLSGFNSVYTSPAEMRMTERVVLYSLIFGLQPRNCLEIGTFRGGSTAIICGAMDDTGFGQIACVDPMPHISEELWSQISHRCRMFEGPSPDILPEVAQQIKTPFDFALIDANHTYDYVRRDIASVMPYLADDAYVLFHDANYPDVKRAIDEGVASCSSLSDCGKLSIEPTVLYENGQRITWAGLRLLKFKRPVGQAKAA